MPKIFKIVSTGFQPSEVVINYLSTMPRELRNIAIIGSGNVAYHIGKAIKRSQNRVCGIYARNENTGSRLAFELGCEYFNDITKISDEVDIILIAVRDDAVVKIIAQIFYPGKLIAHTSGRIGMEILEAASDRIGVFYPLQTMHKDSQIKMKEVPFCIEANTNRDESMLMDLAASISDNLHLVNSEQRRTMHLAAVVACNFSNHMYALADQILKKDGMDLSILQPLIIQTAANIKNGDPKSLQTGPAIRGDEEVIRKHEALLQAKNPELAKLYNLLTQSILSQRNS